MSNVPDIQKVVALVGTLFRIGKNPPEKILLVWKDRDSYLINKKHVLAFLVSQNAEISNDDGVSWTLLSAVIN